MERTEPMSSVAKSGPRVAIAGFHDESVTFIDQETPLEQFRSVESCGSALVEKYRGTNTGIGGIIDVCEREGADIIPLFFSYGGAAGPTSDAAYEFYSERLVEGLKSAGKLDGVLLDLHGAMATPTRLDADRETLERVREAVGPDTPVMVALDYHANLDEETIRAASAVFGYHFSPIQTWDPPDSVRRSACFARFGGDRAGLRLGEARCNGAEHLQRNRHRAASINRCGVHRGKPAKRQVCRCFDLCRIFLF